MSCFKTITCLFTDDKHEELKHREVSIVGAIEFISAAVIASPMKTDIFVRGYVIMLATVPPALGSALGPCPVASPRLYLR